MNLLIVPVVLGQGTRLFPEAGPDIAVASRPSGALTRSPFWAENRLCSFR